MFPQSQARMVHLEFLVFIIFLWIRLVKSEEEELDNYICGQNSMTFKFEEEKIKIRLPANGEEYLQYKGFNCRYKVNNKYRMKSLVKIEALGMKELDIKYSIHIEREGKKVMELTNVELVNQMNLEVEGSFVIEVKKGETSAELDKLIYEISEDYFFSFTMEQPKENKFPLNFGIGSVCCYAFIFSSIIIYACYLSKRRPIFRNGVDFVRGFGGEELEIRFSFGARSGKERSEKIMKKYIEKNEWHPKLSAYEQVVCSICLSDFEKKDIIATLPCLHMFHYECVEQWVQRKVESSICPQCNAKITTTAKKARKKNVVRPVGDYVQEPITNLNMNAQRMNGTHQGS